MNIRNVLGSAVFGVVLALAAPVATAAATPAFSIEDKTALARISEWLNGIKSLRGQFTQISSDGGASEGVFYLRKPGRLRFEYKPPTPLLVVADGYSIAVEDTRLETQDRYPQVESPLSLLLDEGIDLGANPNITAVERRPGELRVTARADEEELRGTVTFIFSDPEIALRYWIVTDPQGVEITVILSGVESGIALSPELFVIRDVAADDDER